MIIWLTGQSGSGKTTIARELNKIIPSVVLDGDDMRMSISKDAGFTPEDRRQHNLRVARLAQILERQSTVIVSVIAPLKEARKEITEICNPTWIYLKRTIPDRKGHFYEEPEGYFTVDHDALNVKQSLEEIKKHLKIYRSGRSLFIGRYQPLHEGHIKLMRTVLNEGKSICVALRPGGEDEKNPYDFGTRFNMFTKEFNKEMAEGTVQVITIPDISEVCYGRGVGWSTREIKLDKETEAISATKIRESENG